MKPLLIIVAIWVALPAGYAQQRLERAEALKYACILALDMKQMLDTPIPTDPDIKRPVAVRGEGRGGMILPEAKLTVDAITKAGQGVVPVGQFWAVGVAPISSGAVIPAGKLKAVEVHGDGRQATAYCCALGVERNSKGELELLVFGKSRDPVLRAPLKGKAASSSSEAPLDMAVERTDYGADVTVKILGKYEAVIPVGQGEP